MLATSTASMSTGVQHNIRGRWEPGLLGNIPQPWTVVQPKGNSQFLLSPLERRHQPRPGLREFRPGQPTAGQTCPKKVPMVTTSALPHNATKTQGSCPQWSGEALELSRKANWKRFCLLTGESVKRLPPPDTPNTERAHEDFARAYFLWLNNVSHVAGWRTMCHAGTKSARASIAPLYEPQWGLPLSELPRPYSLDYNRRRSDGRKLSTTLTSHTLAARRGEQSINLLAGLDVPLACAPSWQIPLPRNSWRTGHTRLAAVSPPGSSTNSCPTYGWG